MHKQKMEVTCSLCRLSPFFMGNKKEKKKADAKMCRQIINV